VQPRALHAAIACALLGFSSACGFSLGVLFAFEMLAFCLPAQAGGGPFFACVVAEL
jgi:hypothetical protein